jgi:Trp operon repressor
MSERGIFMGEKERKRLKVVHRVIQKDITQEEAAKKLGFSASNLWRIRSFSLNITKMKNSHHWCEKSAGQKI